MQFIREAAERKLFGKTEVAAAEAMQEGGRKERRVNMCTKDGYVGYRKDVVVDTRKIAPAHSGNFEKDPDLISE